MDFRLGEKCELLRKETQEFLDEVLTPEMLENCHRTGVNHDVGFAKAVRDKGWLALGWPVEDGGQGRDPLEVLTYNEVMQRRSAPTYAIGTTMMVAHVVQECGTEAQKKRSCRRRSTPTSSSRWASPSRRTARMLQRLRRRRCAPATAGPSPARRCSRPTPISRTTSSCLRGPTPRRRSIAA